MTFSAYDINKLEGKCYYEKSGNLKLLEAFADSGLECVKVEGWTQKTAFICAASIRSSIERYHMDNFDCVSRNGEVFLIRKK